MQTTNTEPTTAIVYPREIVMACLHRNGACRDMISEQTWERAYFVCDGFGGDMTPALAASQCWDWSHVRDSSHEALCRVSSLLIDVLALGGFDKLRDAVSRIRAARAAA